MSDPDRRQLWDRWQALANTIRDLGSVLQNPAADTCPDRAALQRWLGGVAAARRDLDQLLKDTVRRLAAAIKTGGGRDTGHP